MPQFFYISYVATGNNCRRESHEVTNVTPIEWLKTTNLVGYEDAPYIVLHQFEISEAEYLACKNILV